MEELSVSIVRKSLVRRVVMGNMPAQWLWTNIILFLFIAGFIFIKVTFIVSIFVVPFGILSHIMLYKAYDKDELLFSVYFKHIFMPDYIPATSRANCFRKNYK